MNPYVFGKVEEEEICLGSADDLMQRNLDRRFEQIFLREAATKSGASSNSSSPTPSTLAS